jgi:hypothetical protein
MRRKWKNRPNQPAHATDVGAAPSYVATRPVEGFLHAHVLMTRVPGTSPTGGRHVAGQGPTCASARAPAARREPATAPHVAAAGGFPRTCASLRLGRATISSCHVARMYWPVRRGADVIILFIFVYFISFASELQNRQMICPFRSSRRARRNGAV